MLKLNVGFCRKIGEPDYGSRGASTNLEVELDSALAGDPQRLRDHIRRLYELAKEAVNGELCQPQSPPPQRNSERNGHGNQDTGQSGSSGRTNGNGRRATDSQVKAIFAISKRNGIDLTNLLRDRFGFNRPDDLSLREASSLIDELKGAGDGASR